MALSFITNTQKTNLIIFIHGFIGGKETWVRIDNDKSILNYLQEESSINENYDFAVFDYYTEITDKIDKARNLIGSLWGRKSDPAKNIDVESIAQMLKTEIKYLDKEIKNIVLIAHSMGGLVAKSMIIENILENQYSNINLYVSLAVPHRGSNLATFGKILFGNIQIENLQPLNKKIHEMNDQWLRLSDKLPKTIYFQAKYDEIVPEIATVSFDNRQVEVDYTDDSHTGIVKPKSKDDIVIKAIKSHLLEILKEKSITNQARDIIFDIGSIEVPNKYQKNAEIRFSLTCICKEQVKINSIKIVLLKVEKFLKPENQYAAAPVDEFFLYANINKEVKEYELINQHFILKKDETDGFFLKIDGEEGYKFLAQLVLQYHKLGEDEFHVIESKQFELPFPSKSIDSLLENL